MTLIASWVGVDCRKQGLVPASIYIVSDSRISWPDGSYSDNHVKVFACKKHPDIFGYCGDVLFPSNFIHQFTNMADEGFLFSETANHTEKNALLVEQFKSSIAKYPADKLSEGIKILHAGRDPDNTFHCSAMSYSFATGISIERKTMPAISDLIDVSGSGKTFFAQNYYERKHGGHNTFGTSRGIYHCFTDTLEQAKDIKCGGAPQMAGLYWRGNGMYFGILQDGKRYYMGNEINSVQMPNFVEWRNESFERIHPKESRLLDKAQRQPKQ